MDGLKMRAGERLEAIQEAAKSATGNGRDRMSAAYEQAAEAVNKLKEAMLQLWHNELVGECRVRISNWSSETVRRIKEGAPPLSPVVLYRELVELFKDRMWRRSMMIFVAGVACGGATGVFLGLRWASRAPTGPHCRALHSHPDGGVILVDDAVGAGANAGEVLVRVQAFSVCPVDRAVLRGRGSSLRSLITRSPVTVGRGFSGIVLDVGPGVADLEMGDEVWGCVSEWNGGAGSELLTVKSTRVSKRPHGIAADKAASVPWSGGAALTALDRAKLSHDNCKNKRVVVAGAGSGEGCLLVQLLSMWGAHVTVAAPIHATHVLSDLGASEFVKIEASNSIMGHTGVTCWDIIEREAATRGPWDCAVLCCGLGAPPGYPPQGVLRASAPRYAIVDLRPHALLTDRLIAPLSFLFIASFYTYRMLRFAFCQGRNTDFLESDNYSTQGLQQICQLVEAGELRPILDKVYGPEDYEVALAHACGDEAVGTTVIRFP